MHNLCHFHFFHLLCKHCYNEFKYQGSMVCLSCFYKHKNIKTKKPKHKERLLRLLNITALVDNYSYLKQSLFLSDLVTILFPKYFRFWTTQLNHSILSYFKSNSNSMQFKWTVHWNWFNKDSNDYRRNILTIWLLGTRLFERI